MRPMSDFDPSQRCWVHEQLNRKVFAWDPARADWQRVASRHAEGVVNWRGLLFDGWWLWDKRPEDAVEEWPWSS